MAEISRETVIRLAKLSKIALNDDEIGKFQKDLETILQHIEQLQQIDTQGVEPTYQVTGLRNISRPDKIIDYGVLQEDLLKNAPEKKNGMVKVPKVL